MPADKYDLEKIVEWAAFHNHDEILLASITMIQPFQDMINPNLSKLLALNKLRRDVSTFQYCRSLPNGQDGDFLIDDIINEVQYLEQEYFEILPAKDAFHSKRLCLRQKALQLLSVKLCNGIVPEDMRGFSIPSPIVQKNALFKSLKDELYEIFTKYSSLYDGRKSEYEYDVRVFTDKLVKSTEEVLTSTGKSNPNATSSGNKFTYSIDLQEIIERFQTYPIDSFHSELMKMIDNLKEKAFGTPHLHIRRTITVHGQIIPLEELGIDRLERNKKNSDTYKTPSLTNTSIYNSTSISMMSKDEAKPDSDAPVKKSQSPPAAHSSILGDEDSSDEDVKRTMAVASSRKQRPPAATVEKDRTAANDPKKSFLSGSSKPKTPIDDKTKNSGSKFELQTTYTTSYGREIKQNLPLTTSTTLPASAGTAVAKSSSKLSKSPAGNHSSTSDTTTTDADNRKRKAASYTSSSDESIDDTSDSEEDSPNPPSARKTRQSNTPNPSSSKKKSRSDDGSPQKQIRRKWTTEEESALIKGIQKHGAGNWLEILEDPQFQYVLRHRTNVNVKDKYRTFVNAGILYKKD